MNREREGRVLIDATRPFAVEDRAESWVSLIVTLLLWTSAIGLAALPLAWPARLTASICAGLLTVRVFIFHHDYLHGAILRGSPIARGLFFLYGLVVLAPARVWRETHNYHHAHTAKLVGSNVGSYATVNTAMWAKMSGAERLRYRITRHPLTILFGVLTVFAYGLCASSFVRAPRKHWSSLLALSVHVALAAVTITRFSTATYLFAVVLPLGVACALGSYLFYAQHNFPGVNIQARETWSYTRAAMESSSFMQLSPLMHWFTGNIGYHHVHHLNPSIPFYRLPQAMAAIPELAHPVHTSLRIADVAACLRLAIWDERRGTMISYRDADTLPRLSRHL